MYSSKELKQWFRKIKGTHLIYGRPYLIDGKVGYHIHLLPSHPDYYYYFKLATVYTEQMHCYEWIYRKKQIQWQMERRAVNMILQRLIGDNCFYW